VGGSRLIGRPAFAFGLVVLAETGRQPVDNPIPILSDDGARGAVVGVRRTGARLSAVGGRGAHWIMLVLATELFIPQPGPFAADWPCSRGRCQCGACYWRCARRRRPKMRILRVPLFVGPAARCACWGWRAGLPVADRDRCADVGAGDQRAWCGGGPKAIRYARADRIAVGLAGPARDQRRQWPVDGATGRRAVLPRQSRGATSRVGVGGAAYA